MLFSINSVMLIAALQGVGEEIGFLFVIFVGVSPAIGAIIVANNIIVKERTSGTAEWILSKPITRKSFIWAKYLSASLGVIVTAVLIPGVVAYIQINAVTDGVFPLARFLGVLSLAAVNVLVYFAFTFLMGTIFSDTGPVLGASFGFFMIFLSFMPLIPGTENYTISRLIVPQGTSESLALSIFTGENLGFIDLLPLLWAILYVIVFTMLALYKFERVEL